MIFLIVLISGLIIFILAIAFSVSQGSVETGTPSTVGNLGQDVVLDCRFLTKSDNVPANDVSVTWLKDGLSGVVYEYKNKAAQLQLQNKQFSNRAQLFPDTISAGNASLLLRSVRLEDEGVYRCSVNAPKISGTVSVNLGVAAFSPPTFTWANSSLTAEAQRWFPRPQVSWLSQSGQILNSSAQFTNNSAGIMQVVSILDVPVQTNDVYTCLIQNHLVKAVSDATVTDEGVTQRTYFIFNSASSTILPLQLLLTVISISCAFPTQ